MKCFALLILLFSFASCNSGPGESTPSCQEETSADCTLTDDTPPITGDTTGGSTGDLNGGTTGGTTGNSTTTGGASGGTSSGTTRGSGGGTTGGTSGGTSGGSSTTGGSSGGTTGGASAAVPPQALTWDADIYYVNFTQAQEDKVIKAVELMKKVIASKAFKDAVLNFTYNGQKTYVDNGGFTNAQIYQKILDGAEKMGDTSKNNTLNVELELYYALTNTIGYTYPNVTRIYMNTKYFNTYTPSNVSGNLMHEWLHKLGFGHASSYSVSRDSSVPYAIGYIMEKMTKQYQ